MKDFIALFLAILSVAAFVALLQYLIDFYLMPGNSSTSTPKTNETTRSEPVF